MVQGVLTLLLGPPTSGKSTLLKALAGVATNATPGIKVSVLHDTASLQDVASKPSVPASTNALRFLTYLLLFVSIQFA